MAAANQYLATRFLPAYNRRFAVPAPEVGTAFVPWSGSGLADLLCVQEDRVVANDNTVRYHGTSLQIPQDPHRFHYVKVTVRVHAYPDGTLAVFHGPRCLARYHADGQLTRPDAHSKAVAACHTSRTPRRSSIAGQRCEKQFRRAPENLGKEKRDRSCAT
jgi:hypothetical protein